MSGLAPKLPLTLDASGGYKLLQTLEEVVKQNLKNLILTVPGEKMMDPEFGVGVDKYLFEQNQPSLQADIREEIKRQASIYMPYVDILKVSFAKPGDDILSPDNEATTLRIRIQYFIHPLSIEDVLELIT